MNRHGLVLAIYRDADSALAALLRVRRAGYRRSVTLTRRKLGRDALGRERAVQLLSTAVAACVGLLVAVLAGLILKSVAPPSYLPHAMTVAGILGIAAGVAFAAWFGFGISAASSRRLRRLLVGDETFLVIEARDRRMRHALELIGQEQRDRPITFAFYPETVEAAQGDPIAVNEGSPTMERLVDLARALAERQSTGRRRARLRSLNPRLDESDRIFETVRTHLAEVSQGSLHIDLSAEWLLDNAYLIRSHFDEYSRNLSSGFYRKLPVLDDGPDAELPRVYSIAKYLVQEADAQFGISKIVAFLSAYQTVTPLTFGELWAMPLMLRLGLLEHLAGLIRLVDIRQRESEEADFWASRLIAVNRTEPEALMPLVALLTQERPNPSPHFVEQLLGHLYDESGVVAPVRSWVEQALDRPLSDIIDHEQREQTLQQVSLANAIGSLRELSRSDWRDAFEELSLVDLVLLSDPADVYARMDFDTRDQYRHVIERISHRTKMTEINVAWAALEEAQKAQEPLERHVGYYFLDDGLAALERKVAYWPGLGETLRRAVRARPATYFVGLVIILTILISMAIFTVGLARSASLWTVALLAVPVALLASEVAVDMVNGLTTSILPPRMLPKLDFGKGIPDPCKTLVVVPMMLLTPDSIRLEIDRLEVHYLANRDDNLYFALLADFSDAPEKDMPEDLERLEIARRGIDRLASQYGEDRFFLFHRVREWSVSESRWMGWERKRGKIEDLNRLLMNDPDPGRPPMLVHGGDISRLDGVEYVLTIDADTQIPHGAARKLVGAIAHPLNAPRLSPDKKRVDHGYTIIEPRVTTGLPSATSSLFSRLFTDPRGTDPYTHVVADVYQDLSGEASYYGKGIYDVAAFHAVLTGRFPDAHLLSHDLLEGNYVRVGLASDIELFDLFPSDYLAYSGRQHRWIRGDWQIIDWLADRVPRRDGSTEDNPLNSLERWKIFDNLRRSLIPIAAVLGLILAWLASGRPMMWTTLVVVVYMLPDIAHIIRTFTLASLRSTSAWVERASSLARCLLELALLPHQASLSADAIIRTLYRRAVSHRQLLEWETAQEAHQRSRNRRSQFVISLLWAPFAALIVASLCEHVSRPAIIAAAPLLILWAASPAIVAFLFNALWPTGLREITEADRLFLRRVARRTWRFFDDFVDESMNWLPPDNYQALLRVEVAPRTSQTNIGLWLLSAIAARDFGFATIDDLLARLEGTFDTLDKLERPDGHMLNWYETNSLAPCLPRYVSTVDTGNLLASLWAFEAGVNGFASGPVIGNEVVDAARDTLFLIREALHDGPAALEEKVFEPAQSIYQEGNGSIAELVVRVRKLRDIPGRIDANLGGKQADRPDVRYWTSKLQRQIDDVNATVDKYLSWVEVLQDAPGEGLTMLSGDAHAWRREALSSKPSLEHIAQGSVPGLSALVGLAAHVDSNNSAPAALDWIRRLSETMEACRRNAIAAIERVDRLGDRSRALASSLDMAFMYDEAKRVFAIGYNVDEHRMDNAFYDLIASESRLGSLVAIARGDVPVEHWFALGRPFAVSYRRPVMLSWSGTMFEYLMPLLLTRNYENSLLDYSCRAAVSCQIDYGKLRGVPWGISESGYSALDARQIYQYRAFGVPGLALKRDIDMLLVIAPYATVLALMVAPNEAIANMKRLAAMDSVSTGDLSMLGDCGFYEAIDYSRRKNPEGERGVVVRSYMAHHQGMSLVALDNVLNADVMRNRFHSDPQIRAVEPLLYEGVHAISASEIPAPGAGSAAHTRRVGVAAPVTATVKTPHTSSPRAQLLSNSAYSVMATNAGGGYSRWKDLEITRWRADATLDNHGSFCYIKDLESGAFWSPAYQPAARDTNDYSVLFALEKAEFRTRYQGIECITEIVVSPEDDVELRRYTLVNHSSRTRTIELTTYAELALAPHNADRAHPAFSKMFVETEFVRDFGGLIAHRRPRSNEESNPWSFHLLTVPGAVQLPEYESSRSAFIGRGRDLSAPAAMERALGGSLGAVLDPIFSLRRRVTIKAGERLSLSSVIGIAPDRATVNRLATKYADRDSAKRVLDLAWTNAQLELRHLRIQSRDALEFQRLAGFVVYPGNAMRPASERLRQASGGQDRLWVHGISGDLPVVVITIGDERDLDVVQETLQAHSYWRVKGLKCDLVILDDEPGGYDQPLAWKLRQLVEVYSQTVGSEQPGGVFIRPLRQMAASDVASIEASARILLVAARGSIGQQMGNVVTVSKETTAKPIRREVASYDYPSPPLPFLELDHFNGIGGFTHDGREYAIYLGDNIRTPAPWINVLANPSFGALISESGSGYAWDRNSQSNRLTPWNNDAVRDTPGDAIYLRDEEIGALWSPTANPIRERDPYRARHGLGYSFFEHASHGIMQELTVFVPVGEGAEPPVRIQILRLRNASNRRRKLTAACYAEWTLGEQREETQAHVQTMYDRQSSAIFARNPYRAAYGSSVAFLAAGKPPISYTGDRAEFLGRNGSYARPAGLAASRLSGKTGAGFDPCGCIQIELEIDPGREETVVFLLGETDHIEDARQLIAQYRQIEDAEQALQMTREWWNKTLTAISVETPSASADVMVNHWLLYQALCCRIWARSAFYQSSGAYGFRDQLQDVMSLLYSRPQIARQQILRSAARQFREGDVQHWWHVESGGGPRTRISDDLLWLPFVTAQYIRVTGDEAILDEVIPFVTGPLLQEHDHELFSSPQVSDDQGSLLEHCRRAVAKGSTAGPHGLPLIGGGDWNDGLNRVGIGGKGESVWLAWFLVHVYKDMAELLRMREYASEAIDRERDAEALAQVIEREAWDGAWYRRAYFDDGTPLGSTESDEAKIDSLPQSWAVISGSGDDERARQAMQSVEERLVRPEWKIVQLFDPPFNKTPHDPGYIKGYLPGVRENGGQYTHGSLWTPMAYARLGDGDRAVKTLQLMNPIEHSNAPDIANLYCVEPYVVAADIYALSGQEGKGGWTWYTGSAAWMYRVWIEEILGLRLRGETLTVEPAIPAGWPAFKMTLRHGDAVYEIRVDNPGRTGHGVSTVVVDGQPSPDNVVRLSRDETSHFVVVTLQGTPAASAAAPARREAEEAAVR